MQKVSNSPQKSFSSMVRGDDRAAGKNLLVKALGLLWVACLFFISPLYAGDNVVNVYSWSAYIPPQVLRQFEKETHIQVNYSTFDTDTVLYTKLKANPNVGYDVVVPTSSMASLMRQEGMLQKIDKSQLPNFKYLNPALLNKEYDPRNQYTVPYLWGTNGIVLNTHYYRKGTVTCWKDLWQKRFHHRLSMLNTMRDNFSVALTVLGYSINDQNPEHIKQAYFKLRTLLDNVQSFSSDGSQQLYVNEDSEIGTIASGDAYRVMRENPHYIFIYPKDGPMIWIDSLSIPTNAKHVRNAHIFINFILRPDIAKEISVYLGYASPNLGAIRLMTPAMRRNPILNPSARDLQNGEVEAYISNKTQALEMGYWERLKLEG